MAARCSAVSVATALSPPVARLLNAMESSLASGRQSSRTFMPTTMPVAVSASRFMAEACTPPMWFCTRRSLARSTSTRSGVSDMNFTPAVPVKGTARRRMMFCTKPRMKAGASSRRISER